MKVLPQRVRKRIVVITKHTNLSSADKTMRDSWAQDEATLGPTADAKNAT